LEPNCHPGELEQEIRQFVEYYNNHRYHESLNNLTPADVYAGRSRQILTERDRIKKKTMQIRRQQNLCGSNRLGVAAR